MIPFWLASWEVAPWRLCGDPGLCTLWGEPELERDPDANVGLFGAAESEPVPDTIPDGVNAHEFCRAHCRYPPEVPCMSECVPKCADRERRSDASNLRKMETPPWVQRYVCFVVTYHVTKLQHKRWTCTMRDKVRRREHARFPSLRNSHECRFLPPSRQSMRHFLSMKQSVPTNLQWKALNHPIFGGSCVLFLNFDFRQLCSSFRAHCSTRCIVEYYIVTIY